MQRLFNSAMWDAEEVRDDLRSYVVEHIGDETSFPENRDKSAGVASQYAGTLGDTVNSPVGVFIAYATNKGAASIDRTHYLPAEWAEDKDHRLGAGILEAVGFATKVELSRQLLERALDVGMPPIG